MQKELSSLLKTPGLRERVILCRNEEERDRLEAWLCREERTSGIVRADELRRMIEECNICHGAAEKKIGIGSGANRVMVILNSPTLVNIVEKKLLKGESVELMKKMLLAANIVFADSYITNLVKCEVRNPVLRPSQVVTNCEQLIIREIEIVKPRVALVFGDIMPLQRIIKQSGDLLWYNIEHPITLIKNPELKRAAWNTLKLIMGKKKELNLQ